MEDNHKGVNAAILERLVKVVSTIQDNSVKMGQLLAVHNEKLDKQDKVDEILFEKLDRLSAYLARETDSIKRGCERDIRLIDDRLRVLEKKMWSIAGALAVISVLISPIGQRIFTQILTGPGSSAKISTSEGVHELHRDQVRQSPIG